MSMASTCFFQAEDGIRDLTVTGVQTCALPIFEALAADDPSLEADVAAVASELGRAYMLHGDWRESIELCDRAIAAAERLDLRRILVEALITKGTVLQFERYREGAAVLLGAIALAKQYGLRSEERRVGKECRSRWSPY